MNTLKTIYTPNEQKLMWEESLSVAKHALYMTNASESIDELKEYLIELIAEYTKGVTNHV